MMNPLEGPIFCVLCCGLATQNLGCLVLSLLTVVMGPGGGNLGFTRGERKATSTQC